MGVQVELDGETSNGGEGARSKAYRRATAVKLASGQELLDSLITVRRKFKERRGFLNSSDIKPMLPLSIKQLGGSYQTIEGTLPSLMGLRLEHSKCGELVTYTITK